MTTPPPRVPPGGWRDTGPAVQLFARLAGRAMGTEPPAVFRTLGRHRRMFWGWLLFAGSLMPGGRLPRRETELVILRVAHRCGSDYELAQHEHLARRAGLTAEEVERTADPSYAGWTGRDLVLLRVADSLVDHRDVDDDLWADVRRELGQREAVELVMLVGHYTMLATALNTLRVPPDRRR